MREPVFGPALETALSCALDHLAGGAASLVEGCCSAAAAIVDGLGGLPQVDVLWRPVINQGLVRFICPAPAAIREPKG
jgi:hypothetical protein